MYQLPALPYDYNALEPFIDEATMRFHHDKHHLTYTEKLNAALDKHPELSTQDLTALIRQADKLPAEIKAAVVNNGGGYLNHSFFWQVLGRPGADNKLDGLPLETLIRERFGSLENWKLKFTESALALFGSGWTWLLQAADGSLLIENMANQDLPREGTTPILCLDLWEHAYYLKYQNRRADYIAAFYELIDWKAANARLK